MTRILILGYYYKGNLGDDIFEYVYKNHVLKNYTITIANLSTLPDIVQQDKPTLFDFVIVGGGDLINAYYFNEESIDMIRKSFDGVPIIFHGIGLTYPDMLPVLDIGDYFFIRNKPDYETVKNRFTSRYTYYTPDLAFHLLDSPTLANKPKKASTRISKIGVCLPNTWFTPTNDAFFQQIINAILRLSDKYEVYLIPFDTSSNECNSDIILINRIRNAISSPNIFYYDDAEARGASVTTEERLQRMIEYFQGLDCIVASRFHSVILSILTDTPFFALYTQPKIGNLKHELPTALNALFMTASVNNEMIPLSFDDQEFDNGIKHISNNYTSIVDALFAKKKILYDALQKAQRKLQQVLTSQSVGRYNPPQYISAKDKATLISKTITNVLKTIDKMTLKNQKLVESNFPISKIISRRRQASSGYAEKAITEEILWTITDDPYAPYYYGLTETVLDSGLSQRLAWLIDDYYTRFKYKSFESSNKSVTLVNKNFQELHRSGWQYIVDNIVMDVNKNVQLTEQLLIDTYVDKTFHWNKSFYTGKNVIPYTQNWIGFIHHTYSSYNNTYNCEMLFQDECFITSLQSCKSLVVMSHYLAKQIKHSLEKLGLQNKVLVQVAYHPSEITDVMFDWDLFTQQESKQVVQIGNWLRNVFSIYQLELPTTSIINQKSILKNCNSDNYFPPPNLIDTVFSALNSKATPLSNIYDICKISFQNMHVKGLYEHIVEMEESVSVTQYLGNDEYDVLLSKSIVFIHLVDASAVNTIIECILRNTPIIVNKIEPVVELLGENYPLYYTTMYEASKLLDDTEKLKAGHEYLRDYDKTRFHMDTFINTMRNIILSSV